MFNRTNSLGFKFKPLSALWFFSITKNPWISIKCTDRSFAGRVYVSDSEILVDEGVSRGHTDHLVPAPIVTLHGRCRGFVTHSRRLFVSTYRPSPLSRVCPLPAYTGGVSARDDLSTASVDVTTLRRGPYPDPFLFPHLSFRGGCRGTRIVLRRPHLSTVFGPFHSGEWPVRPDPDAPLVVGDSVARDGPAHAPPDPDPAPDRTPPPDTTPDPGVKASYPARSPTRPPAPPDHSTSWPPSDSPDFAPTTTTLAIPNKHVSTISKNYFML